jgi:hypothetical protein
MRVKAAKCPSAVTPRPQSTLDAVMERVRSLGGSTKEEISSKEKQRESLLKLTGTFVKKQPLAPNIVDLVKQLASTDPF